MCTNLIINYKTWDCASIGAANLARAQSRNSLNITFSDKTLVGNPIFIQTWRMNSHPRTNGMSRHVNSTSVSDLTSRQTCAFASRCMYHGARFPHYLAVSSRCSRYTCFRHGSRAIRVQCRFYDRPRRSTNRPPPRRPFTFVSPFRDIPERIRRPDGTWRLTKKGARTRSRYDRDAWLTTQPVQRGLVFRRVRRSSRMLFVALLSRPRCAATINKHSSLHSTASAPIRSSPIKAARSRPITRTHRFSPLGTEDGKKRKRKNSRLAERYQSGRIQCHHQMFICASSISDSILLASDSFLTDFTHVC